MFGLDVATPLTQERVAELVDSIAEAVVRRRLETVAVLFLEAHKPVAFVAGQTVMAALPLIGPLIGAQRMADLAKLIGSRENVERIIRRIEEMSVSFEPVSVGTSEGSG